MKRWPLGLVVLALASAGCEPHRGWYVGRGFDDSLARLLASGGWITTILGLAVVLLVARWVAPRRVLRWWLFPGLVYVGQRVVWGSWWLWAVVLLLVYLLPATRRSSSALMRTSAEADEAPWYWRLSSALVWAAIFLTLDRALGEALNAATKSQPNWGAPFTMLPTPTINGFWSLLGWFFMLVFVLVLGLILLVLLLLWFAFAWVLNAIHSLNIAPVVGLALGFGFEPTVVLFGRSIDSVLAGVAGLLRFFGHSTFVEPFERSRSWSDRVWSLAPLGLVLLVVFGAGPLQDRLQASRQMKFAKHERLRQPPGGAGQPSVHFKIWEAHGIPSEQDGVYEYTVTLHGVDVRQDRLELGLKWWTWKSEVNRLRRELLKSTHLEDESGGKYRLLGTDGRVEIGRSMPMNSGTEPEATLYFDRPEDPYRALKLVLPYRSSTGETGERIFAFNLSELDTGLVRTPVPPGAERVNVFVDVYVPSQEPGDTEYSVTLVGADILVDRLGLHIDWWSWWEVRGLTFQVPSEMYVVDETGRRYRLLGSDKVYPGSTHTIDENIDLHGGTFYFERPADPHRLFTLVVPFKSPKGKSGTSYLKFDLRKKGVPGAMSGTP